MAGNFVGTMLKYRSFLKTTTFRKFQFNKMSGTSDRIIVEMNKETGIVNMQMNKPAANSLSTDYFNELREALEDIEKNPDAKGVIISSKLKNIYSAGLDISEMYQSSPDSMCKFWTSVQDFWLKLYLYPLTTIAAINGHSPGAGSMIAMSCDYRVMAAGRSFIGLNEVLLGLAAPYWLAECMRSTIGQRRTEQALQLGTLFSPDEALKVGLVDAVVEEAELMETATQEMLKWIKISKTAKHLSKGLMRGALAENLVARKQEDVDQFLKFVTSESVQKALGLYFQSLKKKK